jgi:hypothetical protein
MLVLLVISTLAAAFLPTPHKNQATPDHAKRGRQPNRSEAEPRPRNTGLLLVSRMRISNRPPKTVRIERGDELRLEVAAPFGDDVEIPALGLTGAVTPFAPAQFDLLASKIGTFPVRTVDSGRPAGRLLVGKPGTGRCGVSTPATPQGRGSTPSCAPRGKPASQGHGRSARRP